MQDVKDTPDPKFIEFLQRPCEAPRYRGVKDISTEQTVMCHLTASGSQGDRSILCL